MLIASPNDIPDARDAVEEAIHSWNGANARNKQIILQPWRWESAAVPMLGKPAQELINAQAVDESDIVFALFGSRLGSPTAAAVSGTVEEIKRAVEQGKPVHLYFSTAPLPHDVDTTQLEGLREFKREIQSRGLLGEFSNPNQLGHEVWKAIEHDVTQFDLGVPVLTPKTGVDLLVQPRQERELASVNAKGKSNYRTRRWLEITNQGSADAEDLRIEPVGNAGLHVVGTENPTIIHSGQTRTFNYALVSGGNDDPKVRITWTENGQQQQREFHIG
ncbi:hypothetical protein Actkin_01054 [Actinokineospora sp. UTMC 2448]|nr:hypothetical protein Actkin_01054 [Actinokineospora sp. UTMC 2448]